MDIKSFPPYLDIEVNEGIAILKLNRPEMQNRYDEYSGVNEVYEMRRFMLEANEDPDIHVIIQTGTGSEWFSAGAVPKATYSSQETYRSAGMKDEDILDYVEYNHWQTNWLREILEYKKPLITALNGKATSKPLTWVLSSDFVIAERHVTLSDIHTFVGASSATGPFLWPMLTGLMQAKKYIMTGDSIDMETAEQIGLVTEVVDTDASLPRAIELAKQLMELRQETLWLTKRNLNAWLTSQYEALFVPSFLSEVAMIPRAKKS